MLRREELSANDTSSVGNFSTLKRSWWLIGIATSGFLAAIFFIRYAEGRVDRAVAAHAVQSHAAEVTRIDKLETHLEHARIDMRNLELKLVELQTMVLGLIQQQKRVEDKVDQVLERGR